MSKQTLGKTLLRNVIRHTDAHNKIQEESEMWKLRGWEVQMSNHSHMSATKTIRGQMHCDRLSYPSRVSSEHDDREARYWTRKLYDFEDNDPDRWGHSGFKELYPEEFDSDSTTKEEDHKSKASKSKRSKKKKKKKKKKKEEEAEGKRKKAASSNDSNRTTSHHKSKKKERTDEDRQRRKRKNDSHKHSDSTKKRRRDWRAAGKDSTDESSEG
ncbi:NKAP domain containing 1 isoform X2 [Hippocampus zosterae]|uniref:NKAP domain containing 1 isoform X2 n=1 Tax=Hippocampus zosterae TaxID=109293 RepID=UPI00223E39D5|nr:NKAP domain containing 1 isoform X2 [Hippocampus zosterae]